MSDISIYHHCLKSGITRSKRHFSTEYLGAAPNYLVLRGEREASSSVLIGLFQRLWRQGCGSAWKRDPVSGVIGVE